MIRHPVILAIGLLDLIAWAIYLAAAWRLLAALPQWRPASAGARQLWRERALELVAYQGRWVLALQAAALGLFVIGVSNLWPPCVPGAMCGTGVLQAMGAAGEQTLLFRGLGVLLLYCWQVAQRLDCSDPRVSPSPTHGRMLLLAAPLMVLSTWTFGQSLAAMSGLAPVTCCAVLYDQAGSVGWLSSAGLHVPAAAWMIALLGGALLVAAWGCLQYQRPLSAGRWLVWAAAWVPAWMIAAGMGLKTAVAPYVFEVLSHPCPWCFFLWDHHAIGFVLFGLPAWIVAETAAGLTARTIGRRNGHLALKVEQRLARAGLRITAGAFLFALAAAAPMLLWRFRFGGWMTL